MKRTIWGKLAKRWGIDVEKSCLTYTNCFKFYLFFVLIFFIAIPAKILQLLFIYPFYLLGCGVVAMYEEFDKEMLYWLIGPFVIVYVLLFVKKVKKDD